MASLGGKAASLGLEIVEGDGGLPKVCLSSENGRSVCLFICVILCILRGSVC